MPNHYRFDPHHTGLPGAWPLSDLAYAAELLRYAVATSAELAESLGDSRRDLALCIVHLAGMARHRVDGALATLEGGHEGSPPRQQN